MNFYRYFSNPCFVADLLENKHLKVAKYSELNDPFEMSFAMRKPSKPDLEQGYRQYYPAIVELAASLPKQRSVAFKKHYINRLRTDLPIVADEILREHADKELRLLCLTKMADGDKNEILLWSHYANKHQGIRVKLDLPEEETQSYRLKEIKPGSRVPLKIGDVIRDKRKEIESALDKIAFRKASVWMYEKEWRVLLTPRICRDYGSLSFVLLKDIKAKILGIDFGVHCKMECRQKISQLARNFDSSVILRQTKLHSKRFRLEYAPIE